MSPRNFFRATLDKVEARSRRIKKVDPANFLAPTALGPRRTTGRRNLTFEGHVKRMFGMCVL